MELFGGVGTTLAPLPRALRPMLESPEGAPARRLYPLGRPPAPGVRDRRPRVRSLRWAPAVVAVIDDPEVDRRILGHLGGGRPARTTPSPPAADHPGAPVRLGVRTDQAVPASEARGEGRLLADPGTRAPRPLDLRC